MNALSRSNQLFSRIVLPFILFIIVVGAVAWLVQFLPHFRRSSRETEVTPAQPSFLSFAYELAAWRDKDGNPYIPEYEPGQSDHFDFPVQNTAGKEIEVGLERSSCTCSDVSIALLPADSSDPDPSKLTWIPLKQSSNPSERADDADRVLIPAQQHGIVRLGWKAKDAGPTGVPNSLTSTLWCQPTGMPQSRQYRALYVPIRNVPRLQFFPQHLQLDSFQRETSGRFICWSTRDWSAETGTPAGGVEIDKQRVDPGLDFKITPLTAEQRAVFQQELMTTGIMSRVKWAARIDVNVHENKNGVQMDQGPLASSVPLLVQGEKCLHEPGIYGYVVPDIRIHGSPDGRIRLGNFFDRDGVKKTFTILADPAHTMLTVAGMPTNVDVKLSVVRDEGRRYWQLEVRVPPNTYHFPPAQNAIILRSQPTNFYLAQAASALGSNAANFGLSPLGAFPDIAGFSSVITSWGAEARQTRVPVLGVVVGSGQ